MQSRKQSGSSGVVWSEVPQLVIFGRPISWKNSRKIVRVRGVRRVIPSTAAMRWMREAVAQLRAQWAGRPPLPKSARVNLAIRSYLGSRRLIDASNLYQGPEDALQAAGVLEDDSCVVSHDGSRRLVDVDNPRVEIAITPADAERPCRPGPDAAAGWRGRPVLLWLDVDDAR